MAEITFGNRKPAHTPTPAFEPPAESHDAVRENLLRKNRWSTLLLEGGSVLSDTLRADVKQEARHPLQEVQLPQTHPDHGGYTPLTSQPCK